MSPQHLLSNNAPSRSATPPVVRHSSSAKRNVVPFRRSDRRSESEEAASSLGDSVRSEPVPIHRPPRLSTSRDSFGDSVASLSSSGRLKRPSKRRSGEHSNAFTPGVRKTGFAAECEVVLSPHAAPQLQSIPSQGLLRRQFSSDTLPRAEDASQLRVRVRDSRLAQALPHPFLTRCAAW